MLIEKLKDTGIISALQNLDFPVEEMFAAINKESDALYCQYTWVKSECGVPCVDKGYVINAIPPHYDNLAWEEWYESDGKLIHHILCKTKWDECTGTADIPADDKDHPAEICGQSWFYFEDEDIRPYFARR